MPDISPVSWDACCVALEIVNDLVDFLDGTTIIRLNEASIIEKWTDQYTVSKQRSALCLTNDVSHSRCISRLWVYEQDHDAEDPPAGRKMSDHRVRRQILRMKAA